jgi:hypothetical protein
MFGWSRRRRDKNATCGRIVEEINGPFWLDKPCPWARFETEPWFRFESVHMCTIWLMMINDLVIVVGLVPSAVLAVMLIAAGSMELWAMLQR